MRNCSYSKMLDAKRASAVFPTFVIPEDVRLASIGPGWNVQIQSKSERFWVHVVSNKDGFMTGRVDNELIHPANRVEFPYGGAIELSQEHVLDALSPLDQDAFLTAAAGRADRHVVAVQVDSDWHHKPCADGGELFQKYWRSSPPSPIPRHARSKDSRKRTRRSE